MSQPYVGNYSFSISDLEASSKKRYLMAEQKGKPVLDEEISEVNFRNFDLMGRIWERNAGDAVMGRDSFEIIESTTTTVSNFSIKGGTADDPAVMFVKGYPLFLFGTIDYNQQNNSGTLEDDDYTETAIPGISTPSSDRTDSVYVDCYLAEVSSETGSEYQDPSIKDVVLGLQTANRFRIVQDVRVVEGSTTIPIDGLDGNGIYHRYYKLAEIARYNGVPDIYTADITDKRTITTSLKEISNGYGNIHVDNAIVDNNLDVHGTLTIINTSETNQEKLVITCNDPGVVAMVVNKTENGDAVQINKTTGTGHALIVNSGNVGIHTDNPSEALFIHQQRLGILGSNGAQIRLTGNDHSAGALYTTNNYPLYLGVNNNAEYAVIAATTGYVGIHTTNPSNELDINGAIRIRGNLPGAGKILQSDTNGVGTWVSQSSLDDNDWVESGTDVYFNKAGNVGINTSAPSNAKLDVNGQIRMRTDASSGRIVISDANGVMSWVDPTAISDGDWVVSGSNVYNNTGNIGVGTNNPTKKFVVQAGGSDGIHLWNSASAERGKLGFDASQNGRLELRNAAGDLKVLLGSDTGDNYITAGSLGIGTASPATTLDVEGTFRVLNGTSINEISIDGSLVGDSDDAVPTEKAVKTYVDQYSHWVRTSTVVNLQNIGDSVGIGTAVTGTYKLRVDGTTLLAGEVSITDKLSHSGDTNTYLEFTGDQASLYAGGLELLSLTETTQDIVQINVANGDVDTRIGATGQANALFVRGSDGTVGIRTASPGATLDVTGTLILQNGTSINEFSIDGTLAGDSDNAVPTEKAVKTYVDGQAGQWNRISSVLSPKTITDNVGIGTTDTGGSRLAVVGTSTTQPVADFLNSTSLTYSCNARNTVTGGTAYRGFVSSDGSYLFYGQQGAAVRTFIKGSGEAYFASDVGIGTTDTGGSRLAVVGTSTTQPVVKAENATSVSYCYDARSLVSGGTAYHATVSATSNYIFYGQQGVTIRTFIKGSGEAYFASDVGIGTTDTGGSRLAVVGTSTTQPVVEAENATSVSYCYDARSLVSGGTAYHATVSATSNYIFYGQQGVTIRTFIKGSGEAYFAGGVGIGVTPPNNAGHLALTGTGTTAWLIDADAGVGGLSNLKLTLPTSVGSLIEGWNGSTGRTFSVSSAGQIRSDYGAVVYSPADFAEWTKVDGSLENYDVGTIVSQSDIELTAKVADDFENVYGIVTDRATFLGGLTKINKKDYEYLEDHQIERKFNAKKIAMTGHVVVKAVGKVKIGQRLALSDISGVAKAAETKDEKLFAFGFARQSYDSNEIGLIEVRLL